VVCLYVCLSVVTFVSPAKTAEPIEMRFGAIGVLMWVQGTIRICLLDVFNIFRGKGRFYGVGIGNLCCGVRSIGSKRDNSIDSNGLQ